MNNAKFAFVSFFEVFPVNFGSSVVCSSLYKYWPYEKKYFQLSNRKKKFSNVVNISYLPRNFGKLQNFRPKLSLPQNLEIYEWTGRNNLAFIKEIYTNNKRKFHVFPMWD